MEHSQSLSEHRVLGWVQSLEKGTGSILAAVALLSLLSMGFQDPNKREMENWTLEGS